MNWKKIICSLIGHKYVSLTRIDPYKPKKKKYYYQCTRCGRRTFFNRIQDEIVNRVLTDNINKTL